jgi:DNA-binding transcriptional MerR regulator
MAAASFSICDVRSMRDMTRRHFTIAELALAAGTTVGEIRDYQELGLLTPPRRVRGRSGEVAYHQEHVDRLVFIGEALAAGVAAEQIVSLLAPGRHRHPDR